MRRPISITHHQFQVGDASVAFTVTAATLPLTDDKGERQAGIFYVAYTRDGAAPSAGLSLSSSTAVRARARPISISARWPAHRRLRTTEARCRRRRPELVDNPDHWLDLTDLVFIDPVGTGYSRAAATPASATGA